MAASYDPADYDGLLGILSAYRRLVDLDGLDIIDTMLRQLFIDHHVEHVFGVRLLHRHFDILDNERMVLHGPVATPWSDAVWSQAEQVGTVKPCNWLLRDGGAQPYEFVFHPGFSTDKSLDITQYAAFIDAYHTFLRDNKLLGVLGLSLVDHAIRSQSLLETVLDGDRAALNFTVDGETKAWVGQLPEEAEDMDITVPAAWFFHVPKWDKCGYHHYQHCSHCGHRNRQELSQNGLQQGVRKPAII